MIAQHWPPAFRALYGGEWPSTYVCWDLETTGYDRQRDVITEIGHVLVRDGKVVDRLSLVLDWTHHATVPDHWLRQRLLDLKRGMSEAGKTCHITYELMQEKGRPPEEVFRFYLELFQAFLANRVLFVAHGGYAFDEPMFEANLAGFGVARSFSVGDNGMFCSDCIEKANQALTNPRMHPKPDDTLRSYFHRVKYARLSGIKSNLDTHCRTAYGFDVKHGIDPKLMHGAEVDSYCLHLMMEEWRAAQKTGAFAPPWEVPAQGAIVTSSAPSRRRGQRVL